MKNEIIKPVIHQYAYPFNDKGRSRIKTLCGATFRNLHKWFDEPKNLTNYKIVSFLDADKITCFYCLKRKNSKTSNK